MIMHDSRIPLPENRILLVEDVRRIVASNDDDGVKDDSDQRVIVLDEVLTQVHDYAGDALLNVKTSPRGVWVAFYYDGSSSVIFETEVEALRAAVNNKYDTVKFWEFGVDFIDMKRGD
jgi:hypothetical protein